MKTISVKIVHGADIRLVELPKEAISYPEFVKLVADKYFPQASKGPSTSSGPLEGYMFKYTDHEGDSVTLGDSSDFDLWYVVARANAAASKEKPMRLKLVDTKCLETYDTPLPGKTFVLKGKSDSAVCDKKVEKKFEKRLKKLKMLPSKVKADLVNELMVDDPLIQHIIEVQRECDIQGSKGKGECKGKGGKGKGKGVKGKGKGLEVNDQNPVSYGPDRESWLSAAGDYPYAGDWYYQNAHWYQWYPEYDREPPMEGSFGRGHDKGHKHEEKGGGKKVLMARFVSDVTLPPSVKVMPGALLTKTWRVRNDSDKPWPASVFVLCVGGDPMTTQQVDEPTMCEYRGEPCKPGDEREVSVTLTAPSKSGTYEAFWRLCANFPERGFKKFGMRLRVKLTVSPNVDAADVQELESGGQTAEKNSGPSSIVESTEAEIKNVTPVGAVFSADEGSESESAEFQLVEHD
jgi:hypothetical protein